jgi:ribosome-binding protein aMBF1 (putative translation factor)
LPGSSDRNKGPESHTHDIVLDPRVRDLLASDFPDIIDRYEELRALYGVVSQLANIRRALGITQAQLAERLGRPQSLISAIESGRMSPHIETLVALARELGYNVRINLEPRTAAPGDSKILPENGAGSMLRRGRTRKSNRT